MESSDKSVSVENITADLGSERIFTKILRVGVLIYDQFGLFLDDNEYNNIWQEGPDPRSALLLRYFWKFRNWVSHTWSLSLSLSVCAKLAPLKWCSQYLFHWAECVPKGSTQGCFSGFHYNIRSRFFFFLNSMVLLICNLFRSLDRTIHQAQPKESSPEDTVNLLAVFLRLRMNS